MLDSGIEDFLKCVKGMVGAAVPPMLAFFRYWPFRTQPSIRLGKTTRFGDTSHLKETPPVTGNHDVLCHE
jgi:hypothetical protein